MENIQDLVLEIPPSALGDISRVVEKLTQNGVEVEKLAALMAQLTDLPRLEEGDFRTFVNGLDETDKKQFDLMPEDKQKFVVREDKKDKIATQAGFKIAVLLGSKFHYVQKDIDNILNKSGLKKEDIKKMSLKQYKEVLVKLFKDNKSFLSIGV